MMDSNHNFNKQKNNLVNDLTQKLSTGEISPKANEQVFWKICIVQ